MCGALMYRIRYFFILLENKILDKEFLWVGKAVLVLGTAILNDYFLIATLLPLFGHLSKNSVFEMKVLVILI